MIHMWTGESGHVWRTFVFTELSDHISKDAGRWRTLGVPEELAGYIRVTWLRKCVHMVFASSLHPGWQGYEEMSLSVKDTEPGMGAKFQPLKTEMCFSLLAQITSCCCFSVTKSCPTLCDPMDCSMPGFPVLHYLLEFTQIHAHWVGDTIQQSHPLLPLLLPSVFSSIRVFFIELALHIMWPKYWSFSFSISASNEYSGLISFRIDWFDLLAVHKTLKSLLQHHSSKASILQCSAFFMVQLSHPYMTTGKTIALTRWTFVGKVMSLLFKMLSRFVIAFLPRSKRLLISWLQSPSRVILELKKIKSITTNCNIRFFSLALTKEETVVAKSHGNSSSLDWPCRRTARLTLFFFLYKFIYFNWRLITLQYCIGFAIHQHEAESGWYQNFPWAHLKRDTQELSISG